MNQPPRKQSSKPGSNSTSKQNRPATGGPIRTCVACSRAFAVQKSQPPGTASGALSVEGPLRVLRVRAQGRSEQPQVLVDFDGRGQGRGAWLCAARACIELAWKRKSLQRALKGAVPGEELKQQLLQACVE